MDLTVPNKTRAVDFLQGLFSVSSVVLNGRAPGDEEGSHTCFSNPLSETPVGTSVVDLACASPSLLPVRSGTPALCGGVTAPTQCHYQV